MEQVSSLLRSLGDGLGPYVPRVVGALTILLVAWILARLVRAAARRVGASANLDTRLRSEGLTATLADLAYWLVWLFALPALLGTLQLDGLLGPVNAMLSRLLGFLPNLMGAIIVFAIGFLLAKIVREVLTGALTAAGSERLAARMGLAPALGDKTLAGVVASIAFALVLLPTLAAALQPLGLDSVTNPVSRLLDTVIGLIPKLASAALIIVITAVIGRSLSSALTTLLAGAGFNNLSAWIGVKPDLKLAGRSPAEVVGTLVMGALMLLAITQATEVLGFPILTEAVGTLGAVAARVAAALFVLGIGLWLAAIAVRAIGTSTVANAAALAVLARVAIIFFASALALRQAGLPGEIITIAFGSVIGAVAVGFAIAVGIGGRHVAARLLEDVAASFGTRRPGPARRDLP